MKTVYQCDFCEAIYTEINGEEGILEHEKGCYKNPEMRRCESCKHKRWNMWSVTSDYDYYCNLDGKQDKTKFNIYYNEGNCPRWDTNNIKLLRKMKFKKLNEL